MESDGLKFAPERRNSRPWVDRALVPQAACFSSDGEEFELLVTLDAVSALREGTERSTPREAFGILLGRRYMDQSGFFTVVAGVQYATELDASSGHVRVSAQQMEALKRAARRRFPTDDVVGWTHSHSVQSAYSSVDLGMQRSWEDSGDVSILTFLAVGQGEPWALGYHGPDARPLLLQPSSDAENPGTASRPEQTDASAPSQEAEANINPFDAPEFVRAPAKLPWQVDFLRHDRMHAYTIILLLILIALAVIALILLNTIGANLRELHAAPAVVAPWIRL